MILTELHGPYWYSYSTTIQVIAALPTCATSELHFETINTQSTELDRLRLIPIDITIVSIAMINISCEVEKNT